MSASDGPGSCEKELRELLADALPAGLGLTFYHISTPPTRCAAIFAAPPGQKPQRTCCESHFLNVAIRSPENSSSNSSDSNDSGAGSGNNAATTIQKHQPSQIFVFAIEVFIYTTKTLTTLFVSKADSTGFLSLLSIPKTSGGSPVKAIASTFISFLVRHRQRPRTRLVVSLFARAQDQYIYPGSVDNGRKHVLDDRGLVRWWCRVLDPILREHPGALAEEPRAGKKAPEIEDQQQQQSAQDAGRRLAKENVATTGYLVVPGFDTRDTARFFPASVRADPPSAPARWRTAHPLRTIAPHASPAPPRCLVPRFPDDPKARFADELDEEIPALGAAGAGNGQLSESPRRGKGRWKSVTSLDGFWELMAFRQECSSGRLVGFVWVVFEPEGLRKGKGEKDKGVRKLDFGKNGADGVVLPPPGKEAEAGGKGGPDSTARRKASAEDMTSATPSPEASLTSSNTTQPTSPPTSEAGKDGPHRRHRRRPASRAAQLTGPIIPRLPRIKSAGSHGAATAPSNSTASSSLGIPERTPFYWWPAAPAGSRGAIVLPEPEYKRAHDLLLRLDFSGVHQARTSSRRKKRKSEDGDDAAMDAGGDGVNVLGAGLVRKKAKVGDGAPAASATAESCDNVLDVGLARKKRKSQDEDVVDSVAGGGTADAPGALEARSQKKRKSVDGDSSIVDGADVVNVLDAGLVRKKPKVQ
ncbi:histone acetylation protein-domain-containing protein [Lineolata rhizophorae]|uniref:histone acetyltransferase n=1 Tax=Lineolata rhizophorae TaxID=578093 RepID=A0A6A6NVL0_9PEZI|nr:histone acetylation protein-domain-containing protein [Lineolata rhizophorae]